MPLEKGGERAGISEGSSDRCKPTFNTQLFFDGDLELGLTLASENRKRKDGEGVHLGRVRAATRGLKGRRA